jgi:outer membrane protein TolC
METENALIGVNVAALFPDISLSAALSNSGNAHDRSASRRNIIAQAAYQFFEKHEVEVNFLNRHSVKYELTYLSKGES